MAFSLGLFFTDTILTYVLMLNDLSDIKELCDFEDKESEKEEEQSDKKTPILAKHGDSQTKLLSVSVQYSYNSRSDFNPEILTPPPESHL